MPRPSKGARLWFDPKRGQWVIRDGTFKRGTGCRYEDRGGAEEALADYLTEKYTPPKTNDPARILVDDILEFYGKMVAPKHRTTAAATAISYLSRWWAGKFLSEVKASTCTAYTKWRMDQPNMRMKVPTRPSSTATPRLDLAFLGAAIRAFHKEHALTAVPEVTLPPAPRARTRFLDRSEVARLLWAARKVADKGQSKALRRFILLGLYTATRTSAVLSLAWEPHTGGGWIDLRAGLIHRRAADEQETRKRKPPLRIPDHLLPALRRWHAEDLADGLEGNRVVHNAGRSVSKLRLAVYWNGARDIAGLDSKVIRHVLRHTAVTWLLQAGVSVWDTANYAGMSPRMVETVYGHHHPDFQEDAAQKIGRKPVHQMARAA